MAARADQARAIALVLALSLTSAHAPDPSGASIAADHDAVLDEILAADPQSGDVILRRGTSLASRLVLASDDEGEYSHAGVIVRTDRGTTVVHAVPTDTGRSDGRVVAESLSDFLSPDAAVAALLLRARREDPRLGDGIARHAERLADAAVPFDSHFDLATAEELYCTELVWLVFRAAGLDLAEGLNLDSNDPFHRDRYLFPSDLANSPHLRVIDRTIL